MNERVRARGTRGAVAHGDPRGSARTRSEPRAVLVILLLFLLFPLKVNCVFEAFPHNPKTHQFLWPHQSWCKFTSEKGSGNVRRKLNVGGANNVRSATCPNSPWPTQISHMHENRYTCVVGQDEEKITLWPWSKPNRKAAILGWLAIFWRFWRIRSNGIWTNSS